MRYENQIANAPRIDAEGSHSSSQRTPVRRSTPTGGPASLLDDALPRPASAPLIWLVGTGTPRSEESYGVVSELRPLARTRYAPFAALGCPIFEPSSKNKKSPLGKLSRPGTRAQDGERTSDRRCRPFGRKRPISPTSAHIIGSLM